MVREFGHFEQVTCNARHELPDFIAVVISIGQPLQMRKQVAAHVGFDPRSHDMPHICHKIVGACIDNPQKKVQCADAQDNPRGQGGHIGHTRLRNITHHQREHQLAKGSQGSAKQIQRQDMPVFFEIRSEPFQKHACFYLMIHE